MIEDYWQDGFIYYVTFISKYSELKFTKALIFSHPKKIKEIEKVVFNRFKGVQEIVKIDEFDDALLLKEEFQLN
ncbi:hypothetical protein RAK27_15110 [Carnobacterium maltaromaticum]|uniref:Uncharacterized protein n=1 Tax=Carnobacterium maltaromaticum TaxID=2751 RepID=A0AAW9K5I7_CARML|nr:hypothetical protein [Carnobacterium maltaromaticum]MDZ5759991.1 hypothetical protein [Carnobacterium maltaromaticum]